MHVSTLKVKNFRNYDEEVIELVENRNIIIGLNAQGKTNLLEAVEFASKGKSYRTSSDHELIKKGSSGCLIELEFENNIGANQLSIVLEKNLNKNLKSGLASLEKRVKINGSSYKSTRKLQGFLSTVSFKSEDLNLLRGGPKYRRDWLDSLTQSLNKTYSSKLSKYTKTVAQRNKLLKDIFEQGAQSNQDKLDELNVWSKQAAIFGGQVVALRIEVLDQLLPLATEEHSKISGQSEKLTIEYNLKNDEMEGLEADASRDFPDLILIENQKTAKFAVDEKEIAKRLYKLYKQKLKEEIVRKQTLSGPHRDDINFRINNEDATKYGSQGQQRTLVLALKLAELNLVRDYILESPVLLLDDVLAELDTNRQQYLMDSCDQEMQTLITTTHINNLENSWISKAQFIEVEEGILRSDKSRCINPSIQ